jgi:hypothetical protein
MLSLELCEICFKTIRDAGVAEEFYSEFLTWYLVENRPFLLDPRGCSDVLIIVEWLEKKQFVVTTDCADDHIAIKPSGVVFNGMNCHVCLDRKSHG